MALITPILDDRTYEQLRDELVKRKFHLGALVLNKTLPASMFSRSGARAAKHMRADAPTLAFTLDAEHADDVERVLVTIGTSFENYAVVARREVELRNEITHGSEVVVDVPTFSDEISDFSGLARIASYLMPSS